MGTRTERMLPGEIVSSHSIAYIVEGQRTFMLPVEGTVPASPTERMRLCVSLTNKASN